MAKCQICGKITKTEGGLAAHRAAMHLRRKRTRKTAPAIVGGIAFRRTGRRARAAMRRKFPIRPGYGMSGGVTTQRLAPPNESGIAPFGQISAGLSGENLGATAEGAYWAIRALHPCDESKGGGAPIPDTSATESANLEFRIDDIIGRPADATGNWDCEILALPFGDLPIVYRKRPIGGTWTVWRGLAPSGSFIMPGEMTIAGTTPTNYFNPTLYQDSTGFRATYRGVTCILNASSLNNEGFVTSGQWSNAPVSDSSQLTITPVAGGHEYKTWSIKDVPGEVPNIITRCPEAGQWEARKGVYLPIRFPNPAHQYTVPEINEYVNDAAGAPPHITDIGIPVHIFDGLSPDGGIVYDSTSRNLTTSGPVNLNLGVIFFSGINATASIVIKMRGGLEFTPKAESPSSAFIKAAPLIDKVATDAVQQISTKLPLVYEAKFNSLGLLLPAIMTAARTVLPAVAPWLLGKLGGFLGRVASRRNRRGYIAEPVD